MSIMSAHVAQDGPSRDGGDARSNGRVFAERDLPSIALFFDERVLCRHIVSVRG